MKYIKTLIIYFLFLGILNAQNQTESYIYESIKFECPTENDTIKALYKSAFEALNTPKYINTAGKIFFNILQIDKSLCDAYFFTGIALTQQEKHQAALSYYYYADSLATNNNSVFKEELAQAALRVNNVGLARKKYEEIIKYFPEDPDGYYGLGLTATTLGDSEEGLKNLEIAEQKYLSEQSWTVQRKNEVWLMKAILLTMEERYKEAIDYFERCEDTFGELEDFNANLALSAYHLYQEKNDEQWKKRCLEALQKLQDKEKLKESFLAIFKFE